MHRETTKGSHRLPFVASALLLAMAGASAGCADVSGQALQQDVAQLRQDVNSLTLAVHAKPPRADQRAFTRKCARRF